MVRNLKVHESMLAASNERPVSLDASSRRSEGAFMLFRQLFDRESSTYTYLLADENSREAVLVDPVREQVERDLSLLNDLDLKLVYTLETHVHADHVTSSAQLREKTGSRTIVSHRAGPECADIRVHEGELITFGAQALRVLETPGHTDGCLSF